MSDGRVRTMTAEQSMRMLGARRSVSSALPADVVLQQTAARIAAILGAAAAFAGCRTNGWSIFAESPGGSDFSALLDSGALDDAVDAPHGIGRWTSGG